MLAAHALKNAGTWDGETRIRMVPTAMVGNPVLRMHAKVIELSSAALLAMLLCCGAAHAESIPLIHAHGTLQVPVVINGKISLNFTIDSGATDVSIPATIFSLLYSHCH